MSLRLDRIDPSRVRTAAVRAERRVSWGEGVVDTVFPFGGWILEVMGQELPRHGATRSATAAMALSMSRPEKPMARMPTTTTAVLL